MRDVTTLKRYYQDLSAHDRDRRGYRLVTRMYRVSAHSQGSQRE